MSCKRCLMALQTGAVVLDELLQEHPEWLPPDQPWYDLQKELGDLAERLLSERESKIQERWRGTL